MEAARLGARELLFVMSPTELAPTEDQGVIFGIVNTPSNATLEQLTPSVEKINEIATSFPETQFTFQITNPTFGFWGMGLRPWDERERGTAELLPLVQEQVQLVPGIESFPILPPALPGGGQFPVEFVISSTDDHSEILEYATRIRDAAAQSGIFAFPPLIDVKIDQPEAEIIIDRDKVTELGLDLRSVGLDLGSALGGNYINRFSTFGRSYKVIAQLERSARLNPEQLRELRVAGPGGDPIPLETFATIENHVAPRSLNRFEQLNSVNYTGESRQLRIEGDSFGPAFAMALMLIFLVLAAQFNSFRDPFIILAGSVPLAMFGALIFTFLKMPNPNMTFWTDGWITTLNVYSQVGLVMLVGLVAKNGILIVEFANELQRDGKNKLDAIQEAATTRFRPVLMTTVA